MTKDINIRVSKKDWNILRVVAKKERRKLKDLIGLIISEYKQLNHPELK
jgi:hypothetical protein